MATTRDELRQLIETLSDSELNAAKAALDALIAERENALRDAFCERLLVSGLLDQLPARRSADEFDAYEPVAVHGELVSQIIVRERR